MRELKFRAWGKAKHKMHYDSFAVNPDGTLKTWGLFEHLELMQYTGLKDKNGQEIYEGDIIECYPYGIGVIKFGGGTNLGAGDSSGYFYGYYYENQDDKVSSGILYDDTNKLEIIGNIYENPELLEVSHAL